MQQFPPLRPVAEDGLEEPGRFIDDRVVFRQFFCPGCGRLVENEVAVEGEPLLHDIELDL